MKKEYDIIGFEGSYTINRYGDVFRLATKKRLTSGEYIDLPKMKLKVSKRLGYPSVSLKKEGKQYPKMIHRLVAIHFIKNPHPSERIHVHHKNGNIFDWSIKNLEWVTQCENNLYSKRSGYKKPIIPLPKGHRNLLSGKSKKLIDIPDDLVLPLKKLAIKENKSFKKFLEDSISKLIKPIHESR